jgi:hypothetical protein
METTNIAKVRHRTFLALAVCVAIGVGGMTLAQHTWKREVKVPQLSQRNITEKLDGKDASVTVEEVTFEPGQKDSPHRRGRTDTLSGAGRGPGPRAFTSRPSTRFVLFINSSILQQEVHR